MRDYVVYGVSGNGILAKSVEVAGNFFDGRLWLRLLWLRNRFVATRLVLFFILCGPGCPRLLDLYPCFLVIVVVPTTPGATSDSAAILPGVMEGLKGIRVHLKHGCVGTRGP